MREPYDGLGLKWLGLDWIGQQHANVAHKSVSIILAWSLVLSLTGYYTSSLAH